jgi:hypothetical protein
LAIYRSSIAEYRQKFNPAAPELWIEPQDAKSPAPYSYYRLDLASGSVSPPNLTEVNVDPHAVLDPCTFELAPGLRATLSTFVWNGIEFRSPHAPSAQHGLAPWVEKWFDVSESHSTDQDGLAGVIHSVTFPQLTGSGWTFSVDFGSAPVDAVRELIMVLRQAGLSDLEIGSFFLEEDA